MKEIKWSWTMQLLIILTCRASGARILFLNPLSTRSHMNIFDPFINELSENGHTVTLISSWNSTKRSQNVRQISPISEDEFMEGFPSPLEKFKATGSPLWSFDYVIGFCHKVFQNAEFLPTMNQKFDLIIVNGFLNDCFYGYLYRLQVPFIVITSTPAPSYISETVGNYLPPSLVPLTLTDYSDVMTFTERFRNFCKFSLARLFVSLKMLPDFENVYRHYLGQDIPGIQEILNNATLILTNSHFSLNYPRPLLPDVIEIGGIHCRPGTELPEEIEEFISDSDDGVIYFSLGSIIKSYAMPSKIIEMFVRVFSRLPHRIIWKLSSDPSAPISVSRNVKLVNWVPQQDLLGHPSTRLFITHGGLLSMQEAVYHAVPILGIPVGIDQNLNMRKATDAGFGLQLQLEDLTEERLFEAIQTIIKNSTFVDNVRSISKIFRDREIPPLKKAIYWTEYVLKHNGANHLRSGARSMSILQYYSFDVIIILLTILLFTVITLRIILKFMTRSLYRAMVAQKIKEN